MIQSNPPTAAAQRMAEEVVGRLIGAEGIDLTLIGPLSSLAETSTDRLTLESLSGDVAAMDWQDPAAIVDGLAAVGFHAQRAPHPHDDDAPAPSSANRRVFAFDMNRFRGPVELVDALRQLNARRQVRTFAIGAGRTWTGRVDQCGGEPSEGSARDCRVSHSARGTLGSAWFRFDRPCCERRCEVERRRRRPAIAVSGGFAHARARSGRSARSAGPG